MAWLNQKTSLRITLALLFTLTACGQPVKEPEFTRKSKNNSKPGTKDSDGIANPSNPEDPDNPENQDGMNGDGDGNGNGSIDKPIRDDGSMGGGETTPPTKDDGEVKKPQEGFVLRAGGVSVPEQRGYQNMPWEEHQAEDNKLGGEAKKIGPSRVKWDINHIEAEAIGRMAVRFTKTGDSVTFKPKRDGNSLVLRFSIPDSPTGGGIESTISIYIDGKKVKSLPITSKYAWSYNGGEIGNPKVDDPRYSSKYPHTFFDEARTLLPEYKAGSEIKIQKDEGDNAPWYVIDLVDFEKVPPPIPKPEGFVSIEDVVPGLKANDGKDHADAIAKAVMSTPKLYFPPGTYIANKFSTMNEGIDNPGNEVRGAGMWYTELRGRRMIFFCSQHASCRYKDFALFGESVARAEEADGVQKGFAGPQGKDSIIDNIWIEHVVGAIWVGNDPPYQTQPTENLKITNCRIRNVFADGVNFDNGTSNSLLKNCHFRNTGDDAAVVWSIKWTDWVKEKSFQAGPNFIKENGRNAPDQGVGHDNLMENITVQMPWRANCFASYGGYNNTWKNNICEDVLTYPGILIDNEFSPYPFGPGLTKYQDISVIRAGGQMFLEPNPWEHGALKFYQREGSVTDILVENLDIIEPTYAGIEFRGFGTAFIPPGEKFHPDVIRDAEQAKFKNVTLRNITITKPGTYGIEIGDAGGQGEVTFENVKVVSPVKGGLNNKNNGAAPSFFIKKGTNTGW